MENTDNQNTQYHIAHTKLFKSSLPGASGNKNGSRKASHTNGFPVSPARFDNTLTTLFPSAILLEFRGTRGG